VVGVASLVSDNGAFACISSVATMAAGAFLLQEAQRPVVLPILMKAIRQSKWPQPNPLPPTLRRILAHIKRFQRLKLDK